MYQHRGYSSVAVEETRMFSRQLQRSHYVLGTGGNREMHLRSNRTSREVAELYDTIVFNLIA